MSRKIVGMDLNGVWDHVATEGDAEEEDRRCEVRDVGPRSVAVRADAADGRGTRLLGGSDAVSTIYGRGPEFGEQGHPARRRETADAWLDLRATGEDGSAGDPDHLPARDTGGDGDHRIDAGDVLLAGARSAIGWREGERSLAGNAGFCIPDDPETNEAVQARILEALGRGALGGTRIHLVWDSVAVALSMLDEVPALTEEKSISVVVSYRNGSRTHEFRLKKDERSGRMLPVRKSPRKTCSWSTEWGWSSCLGEVSSRMRSRHAEEVKEKVKRQTRAIEHWGRGGAEAAWIRDKRGGWIRVAAPESPIAVQPMPDDAAAGIEDAGTVIAWSPVGKSVTGAMVESLTKAGLTARAAPAAAASRGALLAARAIERRETPWFDHLEGFYLRVFKGPEGSEGETDDLPLISENAVVRAGEFYRTPPEDAQVLKLMKMIWELELPLKKGEKESWRQIEIERTSCDHDVEIVAVQKPAGGYARIEIRSETYGPWREEPVSIVFRPDELQIRPRLVRFGAWEGAWWKRSGPSPKAKKLGEIAARCRANGDCKVTFEEWDDLYSWLCSSRRTSPVHRFYALDTDGKLPPVNEATGWTVEQRMQAEQALDDVAMFGVRTLLDRYGRGDGRSSRLRIQRLNRLHMVSTWTFARCSEELLDLLLDAVEGSEKARQALRYENHGARKAIFHGLGRAVTDRERMCRVIGGILSNNDGSFKSDRNDAFHEFPLACLSHLLARRRAAGEVVNQRAEWIEQLAKRACDNVLDAMVGSSGRNTMSYAILLLGGLARVKSMGNPVLREGTETTKSVTDVLELCELEGVWRRKEMVLLEKMAGNVLAVYRGEEEADWNLLYRLESVAE